MAGTLLTVYTDQLQRQRRSFIAMSLIDFSAITVSEIAAGSVIEIAGAMVLFEAAESMGSNFAAMAQGIVYAYINGVTLVSTYTATAPTWNDELQGWYDATGAHRYYARLYKTAGSEYTQKARYTSEKQILVMADGIGLNPIADADVRIRVASDASVLWDESEGEYVFDKNVRASTLESDGDIVGVDLEISGRVTASKGVAAHYIHESDISENSIFDTLSPFIPDTNDSIIVTGALRTSTFSEPELIISRAVRSNATTIVLYGLNYNGAIASESMVNGASTAYWISIAW